MKGIVFNIFENFIEKNFGEESWDDVLEESKLEDDVFVAPETYDDGVFMKLVSTAISKFNLTPSKAIYLFGKHSFPFLASKIPHIIGQFETAQDFLKGLDSIIHIEVKKLLPGADTPRFYYDQVDEQTLDLEYVSKRNLPDYVIGLIEGLGIHYNEDIDIKLVKSVDSENRYFFKVVFNGRSE